MIVAVSGTHAVGKTTLAQYIATSFGLPLIGEQARELLLTKYKFPEVDGDISVFKKFQSDILKAQLETEKQFRQEGKSFVVDRTPLDSLAYVQERLTADRDDDLAFYQEYKAIVESFMRCYKYDRIYFVRYNSIFHEDDGQRNINPFLMKAIDTILEVELRNAQDLPLKEIKSTDRAERKSSVREDIINLAGERL